MAAKQQPRLGLRHLTVVPTNFRAPGVGDAADEATDDATDEDEA